MAVKFMYEHIHIIMYMGANWVRDHIYMGESHSLIIKPLDVMYLTKKKFIRSFTIYFILLLLFNYNYCYFYYFSIFIVVSEAFGWRNNNNTNNNVIIIIKKRTEGYTLQQQQQQQK